MFSSLSTLKSPVTSYFSAMCRLNLLFRTQFRLIFYKSKKNEFCLSQLESSCRCIVVLTGDWILLHAWCVHEIFQNDVTCHFIRALLRWSIVIIKLRTKRLCNVLENVHLFTIRQEIVSHCFAYFLCHEFKRFKQLRHIFNFPRDISIFWWNCFLRLVYYDFLCNWYQFFLNFIFLKSHLITTCKKVSINHIILLCCGSFKSNVEFLLIPCLTKVFNIVQIWKM